MSTNKDSLELFSCVFLAEQQPLSDSTFFSDTLTEDSEVLQWKRSRSRTRLCRDKGREGEPGRRRYGTHAHSVIALINGEAHWLMETQSCSCVWPHTEATVISQSGRNIRLLSHINTSNTRLSLVSPPSFIINLSSDWLSSGKRGNPLINMFGTVCCDLSSLFFD